MPSSGRIPRRLRPTPSRTAPANRTAPARRAVLRLSLALLSTPAWAALPQVMNVQVMDQSTLAWSPLPGSAGYHVYQGSIAGLPSGNYGSCLAGSLQGSSATVPNDPLPPGTARFFLVTGFDEAGEGQVGDSPLANPSPRCTPVRRYLPLAANGDPGDGVADGVDPLQNPGAALWSSSGEKTGIFLYNGEFFELVIDLLIFGRGTPAPLKSEKRNLMTAYVPKKKKDRDLPSPLTGEVGFSPDRNNRYAYFLQGPGSPGAPAEQTPKVEPPVDATKNEIAIENLAGAEGEDLLAMQEMWWGICHAWAPAAVCEKEPIGPHPPDSVSVTGANGNLRFGRHYRSQVRYNGPLGHGWDWWPNSRLAARGGDIAAILGWLREILFARTGPTTFRSPSGFYGILHQNADGSFTLRDPDGTLRTFHAFDGSNRSGALESVQDRNGNRTTLDFDVQGLLSRIVDSLGRVVTFEHNSEGRVASFTDFTGRMVSYAYDPAGNLIEARSPAVIGTPNGNDFPSGKVTRYTYTSGFADARLNHNLISIIPPNEEATGSPVLTNVYDTDPASFGFDRVMAQTIGGTNASGVPAGGTSTYEYAALNAGADPALPDLPRRSATIVDRNGNRKEFLHNAAGNPIAVTELTNRELRPGEPDYTTRFAYNADGEAVQVVRPQGNRVVLSYDRPGADRYREGNLVRVEVLPDTLALGGRGDGHGGELNVQVWTLTHEAVFNQLAAVVEPRGNDPTYTPQNGGLASPDRYATSWTYDYQEGDPLTNGIAAHAARFGVDLTGTPFGLGDINGDGLTSQAAGNLVAARRPPAQLDPASNQAAIEGDLSQDILTFYQENVHGQLTAVIDAEGNRHELLYNPESDPDGDGLPTPVPPDGRVLDPATGGRLRALLRDTVASPERDNGTDPPPAMIRDDFACDPLGNLTGWIDGRGVLTRFIRNALDQVVEVRRAAATADASGPDGSPPTGRGETGLTPFGFMTRYEYDANDNIQSVQVEDRGESRGVGPFVDQDMVYDQLDNVVEIRREATPATALVTQYRYDANENLAQVIKPGGNADLLLYDERDLPLSSTRGASGPNGGTPATRAYEYDPNGDLVRLTDARGGLIEIAHDGLDRPARRTDQVGNTRDAFYDPADEVVRLLWRGPAGGPTPADRSGAGNVDLADWQYLYDEPGRLFGVERALFVPVGVTLDRPAGLSEGPLLPGDGKINRRVEFDRLSRPAFSVADSRATTRYDHDGLGRVLVLTDAGGDPTRYTYDEASNLVETLETEVSSSPGPPPVAYWMTFVPDALGRTTMIVDNLGQTSRAVYDSLDAVTIATDANGPPGGSISRRTPGFTGGSVPVNAHGNVTRFAHDGAGRLLSTTRVLTATGLGNGTLSPPPDLSNPSNPDGFITPTRSYIANSLVASQSDDRGNRTLFVYDNLDRLMRVQADDGTMTRYTYDAEGNRVAVADADGTAQARTFDPAQRLVTLDVTRAPGVEGTTAQSFEYDGLGRPTRATDDNQPGDPGDDVAIDLAFDSLGRALERRQALADGSSTKVSDTGWMADDLATRLVHPTGTQVFRQYDPADRLSFQLDSAGIGGASFDYYGLGRVHTRRYQNGVRSTTLDDAGTNDVGHDGARRLTLLRHLDPANNLLAGFESRYDRAGNRTSIRRLHDADGAGNRKGEIYAHDSADRLVSFKEGYLNADHLFVSPLPADQQSWVLDGAGNWASFARNGTSYLDTPNNNNEYDEPQSGGTRVDDGLADDFGDNAMTPMPDGLNQAHDKNGSRLSDGRNRTLYDFLRRPVRTVRLADGLPVAVYAYDPFGLRVRRVVTNTGLLDETRQYAYAPPPGPAGTPDIWQGFMEGAALKPIEERGAADALVRSSVHDNHGQIVSQLDYSIGKAGFFLDDVAGSSAALVDSQVPSVLERVTYDPYGKPTFEDPANNPILDPMLRFIPRSLTGMSDLFLGMRYDPELGARSADPRTDLGGYYLSRVRQYDPNQGRRTTRGSSSDQVLVSFEAGDANAYDSGVDNPVSILRSSGYAGGYVDAGPNTCVPDVWPPFTSAVPRPTTLDSNFVPCNPGEAGCGVPPAYKAGIAVSERVLNHAFYSVYRSGLLCLNITSDLTPFLPRQQDTPRVCQ